MLIENSADNLNRSAIGLQRLLSDVYYNINNECNVMMICKAE
jgi:hypothetical protein